MKAPTDARPARSKSVDVYPVESVYGIRMFMPCFAADRRHANLAIRPIYTPRLPSSHTCALDFFLAGDVYNLISSDRGEHIALRMISGEDKVAAPAMHKEQLL